jgi:glycosyltransferase involved in cell wall biosynthesis
MEKILKAMINYSIIIPHYNIPDLLVRCLRSIPKRDDVQVIVVDDNSPDNDKYIPTIPELSEENVEFYVTKDRKGAGHVRNIGLQHAVGKWLIFADSDDFFVDDFSNILDEYVNDSSDIIFFNIKSCDCYETGKLLSSKKDRLFREYEKTGNEMLFRVGGTEPWGKIIKRELVEKYNIKFQETLGHNDLLFSVMTGIKANKVKIVNRPLYWYVIREGSMGHQKKPETIEKIQDRIFAWKSTQEFLNREGIKTRIYLPTIPFIRAFKKNMYILPKLMKAAKTKGCSNTLILKGVFSYYVRKYFLGKDGLAIDQQLLQ